MGKAGVTLAFAKVCCGFCPPLDLGFQTGSFHMSLKAVSTMVIYLEEILQGQLPPLLSLSLLLGLDRILFVPTSKCYWKWNYRLCSLGDSYTVF